MTRNNDTGLDIDRYVIEIIQCVCKIESQPRRQVVSSDYKPIIRPGMEHSQIQLLYQSHRSVTFTLLCS